MSLAVSTKCFSRRLGEILVLFNNWSFGQGFNMHIEAPYLAPFVCALDGICGALKYITKCGHVSSEKFSLLLSPALTKNHFISPEAGPPLQS